MANDYIEDFFERLYNHELEQKRHLDSADSLLIGIVGALMGVGAFYLSLLGIGSWCWGCVFFWSGAVLFVVALLGGLYYCMVSVGVGLGRALPAQFQAYIASPEDWGKFVDGLTTYHSNYQSGDGIDTRVAVDLAPARRRSYIEAGEKNRKTILSKHGSQVKAKRCIAVAVILMLATAPTASQMRMESEKTEAKKMSTDNSAKATDQQQPPQKPKPPEIVVIREGDTKPKGKGT